MSLSTWESPGTYRGWLPDDALAGGMEWDAMGIVIHPILPGRLDARGVRPDGPGQGIDHVVHLLVLADKALDLLLGVQDGCMVLSAELLPNLSG